MLCSQQRPTQSAPPSALDRHLRFRVVRCGQGCANPMRPLELTVWFDRSPIDRELPRKISHASCPEPASQAPRKQQPGRTQSSPGSDVGRLLSLHSSRCQARMRLPPPPSLTNHCCIPTTNPPATPTTPPPANQPACALASLPKPRCCCPPSRRAAEHILGRRRHPQKEEDPNAHTPAGPSRWPPFRTNRAASHPHPHTATRLSSRWPGRAGRAVLGVE